MCSASSSAVAVVGGVGRDLDDHEAFKNACTGSRLFLLFTISPLFSFTRGGWRYEYIERFCRMKQIKIQSAERTLLSCELRIICTWWYEVFAEPSHGHRRYDVKVKCTRFIHHTGTQQGGVHYKVSAADASTLNESESKTNGHWKSWSNVLNTYLVPGTYYFCAHYVFDFD